MVCSVRWTVCIVGWMHPSVISGKLMAKFSFGEKEVGIPSKPWNLFSN